MKTHTFVTILLVTCTLRATIAFAASPADRLLKQPEAWFRTHECEEILDNVLSWQSAHGDWPKNKDTTKAKYSGDRNRLEGTFDNGATTGELRLLAKAFSVTGNEHYQAAFLKGLGHILAAQYENGGWPQYFPLSKNYHRHITFNDGTMIRIMEFLRDVASDADFTFVDPARRHVAAAAVQKGVDCILQCQVV
ncbi:MAG: pectate lyase, partial [Planctomycetales bacterium]|nr:pectate lyase [Planctomycetales bacterium]